ncbi:MAG: SpoIIE family protein phosphatase [Firmicutes bacterium]|nr:SpoIIE family protein phosphatase [Bacillota bacterium]
MGKETSSMPMATDQAFVLGREKATTGRKRWLLFLGGLGLAAFFSRLELAPGITPVGIGLAGSWALAGFPGSVLVYATALLCLQTKPSGLFGLSGVFSIPVFLGLYLKGRHYPRKKYLLYPLLMTGAKVAFLVWQGATGDWLPEAAEAAAAWLLASLLNPGLVYLKQCRQQEKLSRWSEEAGLLSLALLPLLVYLVLAQVTIQFMGWEGELHLFFAFLVLLFLGSKPGSGVVLTMGLLFIAGEVMYGQASPWYLLLLGGGSLLIGLGKHKGKKGIVMGSLFSLVLTAVFWWGKEGVLMALGQGVMALLVFLLFPRKFYLRWQKVLRDSRPLNSLMEKKTQLVEAVTAQLQELSVLFLEVARVFAQSEPKTAESGEEALLDYFQDIARQNCRSCAKYDYCWQEHFYETYRELFDLIAWAEIAGTAEKPNLPEFLARECLRKEQLLTTVKLLIEKEKSDLYWRRRFYKAREFLAEQLAGVSGLVTELGGQFGLELDFCTEFEEQLTTACAELGWPTVEVSVLERREDGWTQIRMEKPSCAGFGQECRLLVAPLASEICGARLAVREQNCRPRREEYCSFQLIPEPCFAVESAVVQLPRAGNEISGDYQELQVLSDHYLLALLSDGMGVGKEAARLSTATVHLVRRMLAAGLERKFALRLLNSLLLLASPEEAFATLDLLLFDQLTGEMELFKIGSAPTYIKKGQEVHVVRSTSLPVGIMKTVEPEYYRDYLNHNDLVVLVSDGAVNLKPGGGDWLLKALKKGDKVEAKPFAQYLAELAKIEADGEINDDLTIMVLQFVEGRANID